MIMMMIVVNLLMVIRVNVVNLLQVMVSCVENLAQTMVRDDVKAMAHVVQLPQAMSTHALNSPSNQFSNL